jgi:hypothetical protein
MTRVHALRPINTGGFAAARPRTIREIKNPRTSARNRRKSADFLPMPPLPGCQ